MLPKCFRYRFISLYEFNLDYADDNNERFQILHLMLFEAHIYIKGFFSLDK
jgi:hypothetical protein